MRRRPRPVQVTSGVRVSPSPSDQSVSVVYRDGPNANCTRPWCVQFAKTVPLPGSDFVGSQIPGYRKKKVTGVHVSPKLRLPRAL